MIKTRTTKTNSEIDERGIVRLAIPTVNSTKVNREALSHVAVKNITHCEKAPAYHAAYKSRNIKGSMQCHLLTTISKSIPSLIGLQEI